MGLNPSCCNEAMFQAFSSEDAPMLGILGLLFTSW